MEYVSAYTDTKAPELDNDNRELAIKFAQEHEICTGIIGYRDLPYLIKKYSQGNMALDYGCGTGFSTKLLEDLGFNVIGADISDVMLEQARTQYPQMAFVKVNNGHTPFPEQFFDLVLSTFVLFDIPSIEEVTNYLREAKRLLKPSGIFIACTGSEFYHINNWLTEKNEIEKNRTIKSGETYNVYLTEYDITFCDFFYTHNDYLKAMKDAGLVLCEHHLPLGKKSDNMNWTMEWTIPPYSVYVCAASPK